MTDHVLIGEVDKGDAFDTLENYFRFFDPRHEREEATFRKLGYIDLQFLVPRIRADVLMYTSLMDTICPPSTQFAAKRSAACAVSTLASAANIVGACGRSPASSADAKAPASSGNASANALSATCNAVPSNSARRCGEARLRRAVTRGGMA